MESGKLVRTDGSPKAKNKRRFSTNSIRPPTIPDFHHLHRPLLLLLTKPRQHTTVAWATQPKNAASGAPTGRKDIATKKNLPGGYSGEVFWGIQIGLFNQALFLFNAK
jgi:hypothetical protein